ncbi:hypothetical protein LWI28_024758 [Acer negundo]|uniref:Phototropic-responsive NPH3 family protein n=1 Tax=Acer negundo TaxID=4023 RepID=A0AAD5NW42_ACENE|nr:hypothetical protein LWI28_024758 [Acer negundo]
MEIRIISREIIKPCSSTPDHLRSFKLSAMDQFSLHATFPFIFFYSGACKNTLHLKKSLSQTLTYYYPFAGRLKNGFSVDCDDYGVPFIEASVAGDMSELIKQPKIELLEQLRPYNEEEMLSSQVTLAVQVNHFDGGGVAICVYFRHAIADGCAAAHFVRNWSKVANCGGSLIDKKDVIFDCTSIFPSQDVTGAFSKRNRELANDHEMNTIIKWFVFNNSKIAALQEKIGDKPTRFQALLALMWGAMIDANIKEYNNNIPTPTLQFGAIIPVNLRRKLNPALPEQCIGNPITIGMTAWPTKEEKIEMGVVTVGELKPSISGKRSFRPSSSIRHATEWPISDVSSDLTIEVGSSNFALHKFPLVSRSGRIRKLLSESKETKISRINLSAVPGGSEAFEQAAKFCYGVNVEITLLNVAMLRCAAHFLEMTEDLAEKNLETRAEAYLKEMVFPNISNSISVLHRCESLLPVSEEINLVNRLINSIANNACKEQLTSGLLKLDHNFPAKTATNIEPETPSDWWGKSLAMLNLDFFQRVLSAVKSKGLKQDLISKILINYAHNSLQGLVVRDPQLVKGSLLDLELQKRQRIIVEAIVGLLPTQSRKSPVPMAFLSSLLKTAIAASAITSCRSDLERRIGLQLDQAILEDILIPANSHGSNHSTLYDTDSMLRIFSIFLNLDEDDDEDNNNNNHLRDESEMVYDFDSPGSPKQSSIIKVSKLLDNYLAEVALDSNLLPSKFIALAELLPDHARIVSDGLYRAVDIFLKVHPNMKDSERYRLCKTIDCQKLSQEACSHAAQNERLPVQMAVQVLYFEQIRLRNAMSGGHNQFFFGAINNGQFPQRSSSGAGSGAISPRDNYASVRRENRELKLEVARMRMRLTDLEKDHVSMKQELVRSHPANKLFKSFTKKLSKLNALFRINGLKPVGGKANSENRFMLQKRWRHSVS